MNKDILKALGNMGVKTETNANEVMNTGATGFGAEMLPDEVLAKDIFDAIPDYATFLGQLKGYHGSNMDKIQKVPVLGDPGLMELGAEQTTGALALAQGSHRNPTAEVTITQKKLEMTIDVSDELSTFNVADAAGFEARLKEKIGKAAARTVEAAIINGDSETGGVGNVNSDDGAPAATKYYLGYEGLRKQSIVTDTNTVNVGTAAVADVISVLNGLGDYASDASEVLYLFNRATYNTFLGLQAFYDAAQRGEKSTIAGNAITNLFGGDVFIARDLGLSEADGKQSTVGANNTLGQFLAFWKPAVQYGYGKELSLKLFDMGKDGYQLQGWLYFGFAVYNDSATRLSPTCVVGRNVTV